MLEQCDGFLTMNDVEAATILNNYFSSVYMREILTDIPTLTPQHIIVTFDEVCILLVV